MPVAQDPPPPPPEGEAAEAAAADPKAEGEEGEGGEGPRVMAAEVQKAREKHEAAMIAFVEEYHETRGERPVTRPSLIPSDVEEHKVKVQAILDHLIAKAQDDREASVKAVRLQLLNIWRLFNLLGAAVFDDVSTTARATAASACEALEAAYQPLAKDRAKKCETHQAALKPILANANKQAELKALAQAEADRSAASTAAAEKLRDDMLAAETEQSAIVTRRLVHQAELLLSLLDAAVAQEDLIDANEPPVEVHHALKRKLREETREMALAGTTDVPQEGRTFLRHEWKGLPLGELVPEKAASLLEAPPAAAPTGGEGGEGAEGEAPAEPEVSPTLTSNMTRSHRSVISTRNRIYAAYKLYYAARVKQINARCEASLLAERQWTASWKKLVNRIAIDTIEE